MKLEEVMERQEALKRLNQLLRRREVVGPDNKWINSEISEIETFLKEKEEKA